MLSRFFSSSQPFHYLMGILILGPVSILLMWLLGKQWEWSFLIIGILLPLALLLVQFISLKNELTGQNSYGLFAYTMLMLSLIILMLQLDFALCLLLLLLALRRLLSVKTGTATIRKIFDATFWICLASLIIPAMSIFLLTVFTAIFLFDRTKWRHWVIPFVAISSVVFLSFTLEILLEKDILTRLLYIESYQLAGILQAWSINLTTLWIIAILSVIGFIIYIIKLVDIQQRVRPRFSVLTITGLVALVLLLVFNKHFVIMLLPVLAIFQVRALENINHRGFRELLFLTPIFLLIVALVTR